MKKLASLALSFLMLTSVGCTNRDMGTFGGATLGGLAGYGLSGGSGVGAAVGAVGGGFLGNAVAGH